MSARTSFPAIDRSERRFVAVTALVAMLLTAIPPVVGVISAGAHGAHWNGIQILSPGDFGVYLSYISQAARGQFAFENMYTVAELTPVVNVLWAAVGALGGLSGLGPLAAFHLARTLLIPALAFAAYAAAASFIPETPRRKVAFLLFMFGSGLGIYFAQGFAGAHPVGGSYEWPIDLWVGESNAFMSMAYSPHFIASFALILSIIVVMRTAFVSRRSRDAIIAGLLGLVLFQFHPFHAPTLYAVLFSVLIVETVLARRFEVHRWGQYALFVILSAPSVVYHYVISIGSEEGRAIVDANLTLTPSPIHLAIGFGCIGILAAIAAPRTWRSGEAGRFLVIWAVVQTTLLYAPLGFQRRLIEGLSFPLSVMAAGALIFIASRVRPSAFWRTASDKIFATFLALVLLGPSSFAVIARNVDAYISNAPPVFFHSDDQRAIIEAIRTRTPEGSRFVSLVGAGGMIAGWADRKVYVGHWVNSGDVEQKQRDVMEFFMNEDPSARSAFMLKHGLTHVFVGPEERRFGRITDGPFESAFVFGPYEVLRFVPEHGTLSP